MTKNVHKTHKVQEFLDSEEGLNAHAELTKMMESADYNTSSTYSPASDDGILSFIDKHMTYLCCHLSVDASQYVANIRLITKIRR